MRRSSGAYVFLLTLAFFASAGVGAAIADATPAQPQDSATSTQDAAGPAAAAGGKPSEKATTADTPAVVVDDNNVESLLGKDVKSDSSEKLGQITDILVSHSGQIRAAVIDFGGFLGVGSRKIAVAWPTLHFSQSGITLGMTRDELRVTPEYHQGEPIVIVGAAATAQPQSPPSPVAPQSPAATK